MAGNRPFAPSPQELVMTLLGSYVHPVAEPELPTEPVAPSRGRAEAVRLFDELHAATAERAQRHFDSTAERVAHA